MGINLYKLRQLKLIQNIMEYIVHGSNMLLSCKKFTYFGMKCMEPEPYHMTPLRDQDS